MWTFLTWKTTLMTEGFHRCTPDTTRGGPSSLCCSLDHRGTRIWSRCFLATSASTGLHPWCQGAQAKDARCHLTADDNARTARGMPGGGPKDMDMSHRCKDLVRGVGDLVEVQPTSWGKSGAKWWIPNQDHGRSGHGPSALQGHDCAAMLSKEMLTKFRMNSIKTSFIQPEGGSVVPCTSQRGNSDESHVVQEKTFTSVES